MQYGYKLSAEGFGHRNSCARRCSGGAGFDFVEISDHYHPWLTSRATAPSPGACSARWPRGPSGSAWRPGSPARSCGTTRRSSPRPPPRSPCRDGRFTLGLGSASGSTSTWSGWAARRAGAAGGCASHSRSSRPAVGAASGRSYRGGSSPWRTPRIYDLPGERPPGPTSTWPPAPTRRRRAGGRPGRRHLRHRTRPRTWWRRSPAPAATRPGPPGRRSRSAWGPDDRCRSLDAGAAEASSAHRRARVEGDVRAAQPGELRGGRGDGPPRGRGRARAVRAPTPPAASRTIREYEQVGYDHVVLVNSGPDPDGFMDFFTAGADAGADCLSRRWR